MVADTVGGPSSELLLNLSVLPSLSTSSVTMGFRQETSAPRCVGWSRPGLFDLMAMRPVCMFQFKLMKIR